MNRMLIVVPFTVLLLSACVVSPEHHGSRMVVAPALPVIVVLDSEPYYYHQGYHYYYDNNHWRYSNSRSGPWTDLPRSHYPKETKFRGRSDDRHGGRESSDGRDGDYDRHDRR